MDVKQLLTILEAFLFECVWDRIEDVSELPKILASIEDIGKEDISRITRCEITDVNDALLENYAVSGKEIHIYYHFAFEMDTFIDDQLFCQIKAHAQLDFSIPDADSVDWSVFEMPIIDFFVYYPKYRDMVRFQKITYDKIVYVNKILNMLPKKKQNFVAKIIQRLFTAWDSNYTKVMSAEARAMEEAEKSGFIDTEKVDWENIKMIWSIILDIFS